MKERIQKQTDIAYCLDRAMTEIKTAIALMEETEQFSTGMDSLVEALRIEQGMAHDNIDDFYLEFTDTHKEEIMAIIEETKDTLFPLISAVKRIRDLSGFNLRRCKTIYHSLVI